MTENESTETKGLRQTYGFGPVPSRIVYLKRIPDALERLIIIWVNQNGNLAGKDNEGKTRFTWQPHGSQFTIHVEVPKDATKFAIKEPPKLSKDNALKSIDFDESWITIIQDAGKYSAGKRLKTYSDGLAKK